MILKRKLEKRDILNLTVILILIGFFIWVGVEYNRRFGEIKGDDLVSTAENLKQLILSYNGAGIWIMILLHALQVVVSFIPASLVQFAGAAIYGMGIGMLIGIGGVAIGSTMSFYASRLLGKRVITLFVSEKSLNKLEGVISSDASSLALLILFIIPFPKDFIAYFIGLTNMKASKFFMISAIGRLPGMFVASYLGAHIFDRNYVLLVAVCVISGASFLLAYIFRGRILSFVAKKR